MWTDTHLFVFVVESPLRICKTWKEQSALRALLLGRGSLQLLDGSTLGVDLGVGLVEVPQERAGTKLGQGSTPDLEQHLGTQVSYVKKKRKNTNTISCSIMENDE